jgi:hypothetical protein
VFAAGISPHGGSTSINLETLSYSNIPSNLGATPSAFHSSPGTSGFSPRTLLSDTYARLDQTDLLNYAILMSHCTHECRVVL